MGKQARRPKGTGISAANRSGNSRPTPVPVYDPSGIPFLDDELLTATQDRYREIAGAGWGIDESAVQPARRGAARGVISERLAKNPREALTRRLCRLGMTHDAVERVVSGLLAGTGVESEIAAVSSSEADRLVLERLLGRNDLLGINYLDAGRDAARSVARVMVRNQQGVPLGYGTGFLVSRSLLLTNNHVLRTETEAEHSAVQFEYQVQLDGALSPAVTFSLAPAKFFLTSPLQQLDYTLVAVAPSNGAGQTLQPYGYKPLSAGDDEVLAGESVTIIQHPGGEPKQIALRENEVLKLPAFSDRFLHYKTDTTPGSSGSPVYDDAWHVVALHHSGVPRRDTRGRILTRDGQVWIPSMGEHRIDWIANEGIRVSAILDDLRVRRAGLTADRQVLLDEVLSPAGTGQPPPETQHGGADGAPGNGPLPGSPVASPGSGAVTNAPPAITLGTVTWTIPLQISVTLGGTPGQPVAVSTPGSPIHPPTPSQVPTHPGLAELEQAAARSYYREVEDQAARDAYYQIDPDAGPTRFFHQLHNLLETTHTVRPKYKPSVHLYPWIDLQPARNLKSIYTGQEYNAREFLEREIAVEEAFEARLEQLRSLYEGEAERMNLELSLLEAATPFNCEHVVPQSWFGKREPMKGDLHHLFTCESGCNSFRGNVPYFDFGLAEEAVRIGCGERVDNKFEPNKGKGAAARATLYFLVRYPGEINRQANEYTADRLAVLLAWHEQDAVGKYERHRNQAIFEKQGNRNPFIDHPEWTCRVDFVLGLG